LATDDTRPHPTQRRRSRSTPKVPRTPESIVEEQENARFRALYVAIARLFADQLAKDVRTVEKLETFLKGGDRLAPPYRLSLAGKWAPTGHCSHDKYTNISTAVAMVLHQHEVSSVLSIPSPIQSELSADETHVLRSFYQRLVLRPLRSALVLPKVFMTANRWNEIQYKRAASICMKNNTKPFFSHDKDRFTSYLKDVEIGKSTISGATLLPHILVKQAVISNREILAGGSTPSGKMQTELTKVTLRVVDAQWETLVGRLKESGALESSLAICDVSASMGTLYDLH